MSKPNLKVISGGQTGVDHAGLEAAHQLNIPTGGWMPKGFRRLDGKGKEIAQKYGLKEHPSSYYPLRTESNVRDSDLTIILAAKLGSPGEGCTIKALKRHQRPFLIVPFSAPPNFRTPLLPAYVAYMIEYAAPSFKVINVAGNSERTCPGIYEATLPYLNALFQLLLLHQKS